VLADLSFLSLLFAVDKERVNAALRQFKSAP
jgi:hypothetical protein